MGVFRQASIYIVGKRWEIDIDRAWLSLLCHRTYFTLVSSRGNEVLVCSSASVKV
jgi:hypothetical protein